MDQNTQPAVLAELDAVHEAVLSHDPRILASDLGHVHGVLTTNGALLHLPPGHGRGMAVYPHQALLNHSCLCNTTSQDFPQDRKVVIQARFPIKAGEEITTSYIRATQVIYFQNPKLVNNQLAAQFLLTVVWIKMMTCLKVVTRLFWKTKTYLYNLRRLKYLKDQIYRYFLWLERTILQQKYS